MGSYNSQYIFNGEENSKKPFCDIEELAIFIMYPGNTVEHYNYYAKDNSDHQENIKQPCTSGIRIKNNIVKMFFPAHI